MIENSWIYPAAPLLCVFVADTPPVAVPAQNKIKGQIGTGAF